MKKIFSILILIFFLNSCNTCDQECQKKKYLEQDDCAEELRYLGKSLPKSVIEKMFDSCMKAKGY